MAAASPASAAMDSNNKASPNPHLPPPARAELDRPLSPFKDALDKALRAADPSVAMLAGWTMLKTTIGGFIPATAKEVQDELSKITDEVAKKTDLEVG